MYKSENIGAGMSLIPIPFNTASKENNTYTRLVNLLDYRVTCRGSAALDEIWGQLFRSQNRQLCWADIP